MPVIMSKIFTLPSSNISVSNIEVGSSVYLNVDGVKTEFLVVHQGNPNSSLYDASCDGTWLLMKDIYENHNWDSTSFNEYESSAIHTYLNEDFLSLFDMDIQNAIVQATIPYVSGTGSSGSVLTGANGLSTKIFLLSGYEVGWTKTNASSFFDDGTCLSYFSGTAAVDSKRIAYIDGTATRWYLRTPYAGSSIDVWLVLTNGDNTAIRCTNSYGIRPALILPSNALFDPTTMEFLGVVGGNDGGSDTPSEPETYTVTITGTPDATYGYATINGSKISTTGTYSYEGTPTISVYIGWMSTPQWCVITLNGETVLDKDGVGSSMNMTGGGSYTLSTTSTNITIEFSYKGTPSANVVGYAAAITTS